MGRFAQGENKDTGLVLLEKKRDLKRFKKEGTQSRSQKLGAIEFYPGNIGTDWGAQYRSKEGEPKLS